MALLGDLLMGFAGYGVPKAVAQAQAREELERERAAKRGDADRAYERQLAMQRERIEAERAMHAEKLAAEREKTGDKRGLLQQQAASATAGLLGVPVEHVQQVAQGQNPFTREAEGPVDDQGRGATKPDTATFMKVAKEFHTQLGQALAGPGADDIADANLTRSRQQREERIVETGDTRAAGVNAAAQGKPGFHQSGGIVTNAFTGETALTDKARADIEADRARAGQSRASADEHVARAAKLREAPSDDKAERERQRQRLAVARERVKMATNEMKSAIGEKAKEAAQAKIDAANAAVDEILNGGQSGSDRPAAPTAAAAPAQQTTPPASMLKAGVNTRFKNGQVWTLRDGKPVRVN